jgi:hypothetical protein
LRAARAWDRVFDGAWTLFSGLDGISLGVGLYEANADHNSVKSVDFVHLMIGVRVAGTDFAGVVCLARA